MKQDAIIAGVGVTPFGKHQERSLSSLALEAIGAAIKDAGVAIDDIQAAWSGTAAAPVITGQVCIAGQSILRRMGLGRIPVVNVENACATSSTAFQQAASMVTFGAYDVVLAFGVDKLYHADKQRVFSVFEGCSDVEQPELLHAYLNSDGGAGGEGQPGRSVFMDIYARIARRYMARSGASADDFAEVSAKNSVHGSLNENAQYRSALTREDVLASKQVVDPLTLLMCSPIGDGGAAAVLMSEAAARRFGVRNPIRVLSSVVASGFDRGEDDEDAIAWTANAAYEAAGVDPADIDCVELHDASSPAELTCYEALGLCARNDGVKLLRDGVTRLGGQTPVNTSGGLVRKGHPIGATGLAQIHELTLQLRGEAGPRQVEGARLAVAENGGGFLGNDAAAIAVTALGR